MFRPSRPIFPRAQRAPCAALPWLLSATLFGFAPLAFAVRAAAPRPAAAQQAPASPAPAAAPAPKPAATRAKPAAGAASKSAPKPATAKPPASLPAPNADVEAEAWKLLSDGSAAKKYVLRSDALAAMGGMGVDPRSMGALEHALTDDASASIRALAAVALGELKAQAAIPSLRVALDDRAPQVSFAAAQALWRMGDRSGREIFYAVLEGQRKAEPGVVESKIHKLRQDLREPKTMILLSVNAASGALLGPGALGVSAIEAFALNKTSGPRALSASLLAEDDTPPTVTELRDALDDKDWSIRAAACRSLAALNHPDEIPRLARLMREDKSQPARFAAAAAILRLGSPHPAQSPAPSASPALPPPAAAR